MTALGDIEGVGAVYAEKLRDAGVGSVEALLKAGATAKGRADLAAEAGVSPKQLLTWVNHADLFRIKGVGGEFAELLEGAGVDSVPELAQRSAANLAAKLGEVNATKKLVRQVPSETQVATWVAEAKSLGRVVMH